MNKNESYWEWKARRQYTYWEVVYYSDGTMPLTKQFDNEQDARDFWAEVGEDPRRGQGRLAKIEVLDENK